MTSFYSPCKCWKFEPTPSGQSAEQIGIGVYRRVRYLTGTGQTVCKHCGRHEPRKEK